MDASLMAFGFQIRRFSEMNTSSASEIRFLVLFGAKVGAFLTFAAFSAVLSVS